MWAYIAEMVLSLPRFETVVVFAATVRPYLTLFLLPGALILSTAATSTEFSLPVMTSAVVLRMPTVLRLPATLTDLHSPRSVYFASLPTIDTTGSFLQSH